MELSQAVRIWPPIAPMKSSACKWNTIQKLDRIAAKVTHTSRPRTQLWDRSEIPTDKVMKRCYSSYQTYVIIPNKVGMRTPPFYHSKGVLNIPVAIGWTKIGLCLFNNGVSSKYTLSIWLWYTLLWFNGILPRPWYVLLEGILPLNEIK